MEYGVSLNNRTPLQKDHAHQDTPLGMAMSSPKKHPDELFVITLPFSLRLVGENDDT
jgi:hypothetical protein